MLYLIILALVSAILGIGSIFVPKLKLVFRLILLIGAVFLSYSLWESIAKPIRFETEKEKRYDNVIKRLKYIRTSQIAFKSVNGVYCANFDSLVNFIKTDSFPAVKAIGNVPDSLTEKKALEMGLIKRDTIMIGVMDSIFKNINFSIDSLAYVPFSESIKFELDTSEVITGSKLKVKVFEAKVSNFDILSGLDRQAIVNLNDGLKYAGLRVGSLEEANNNAGNWE